MIDKNYIVARQRGYTTDASGIYTRDFVDGAGNNLTSCIKRVRLEGMPFALWVGYVQDQDGRPLPEGTALDLTLSSAILSAESRISGVPMGMF